jgi:hypothetical protein
MAGAADAALRPPLMVATNTVEAERNLNGLDTIAPFIDSPSG